MLFFLIFLWLMTRNILKSARTNTVQADIGDPRVRSKWPAGSPIKTKVLATFMMTINSKLNYRTGSPGFYNGSGGSVQNI